MKNQIKKFSLLLLVLLSFALVSLSHVVSNVDTINSSSKYLAAETVVTCYIPATGQSSEITTLECNNKGGSSVPTTIEIPGANATPLVTTDCKGFSSDLARQYCNSPLDLLPAWRWNSFPLNISFDGGIAGMIKSIGSVGPNVMASFFFLLSGFIWKVILYFINLATSTDIISLASNSIDTGYYSVASMIFGSDMDVTKSNGILIIGIGIFLFTLGKLIAKGKSANIVRMVVTFLVPLTFMYGIATLSDPDRVNQLRNTKVYGTGNFCDNLIVGTPSWIGCIGTSVVDQVASQIATMPSIVSSSMANTVNDGNKTEKYSCEKYMSVLYNAYAEVSSGRGGNIMSFKSGDKKVNSATMEASLLWQRSWLTLWSGANMGTSEPRAGSATCHILEYANDIPPSEQAMIAKEAYQSGLAGIESEKAYSSITGGSASNGFPFYPWIACQGNPDDKTQKSWELLWSSGSDDNGTNCAGWLKGDWINGSDGGYDFLNWGKLGDLGNDYNVATSKLDSNSVVTTKSLMNAKAVVSTYRNDRVWDRVLLGLIAMAAATAMAFVLGLVSLGAVVAQVGLVLLLIWLPVTLFIIAVPFKTRDGDGKSVLGMKLLKLTFGFMTSKFILLLTMLLIIQASTIVSNIIDSIGA